MVVWSPLALGVTDAIVANWNFWGKKRTAAVRSGNIWRMPGSFSSVAKRISGGHKMIGPGRR
jgi:hypothetical protein